MPLLDSTKKKPDEILAIDDREKSLLDPVRKEATALNLGCRIVRMDAGDYALGDALAETKTPFDFINSLFNGHLAYQIGKLRATGKNICICIIGAGGIREFAQQYKGTHRTDKTAVQIEAVMQEFIAQCVFINRIPILFWQNPHDFVRFMKHAKNVQNHVLREAVPRKGGDSVLRAFASPEGVGASAAKALKDKYGKPAQMIEASDEDIMSTAKEIGPKRLDAIRATFGRYGSTKPLKKPAKTKPSKKNERPKFK